MIWLLLVASLSLVSYLIMTRSIYTNVELLMSNIFVACKKGPDNRQSAILLQWSCYRDFDAIHQFLRVWYSTFFVFPVKYFVTLSLENDVVIPRVSNNKNTFCCYYIFFDICVCFATLLFVLISYTDQGKSLYLSDIFTIFFCG